MQALIKTRPTIGWILAYKYAVTVYIDTWLRVCLWPLIQCATSVFRHTYTHAHAHTSTFAYALNFTVRCCHHLDKEEANIWDRTTTRNSYWENKESCTRLRWIKSYQDPWNHPGRSLAGMSEELFKNKTKMHFTNGVRTSSTQNASLKKTLHPTKTELWQWKNVALQKKSKFPCLVRPLHHQRTLFQWGDGNRLQTKEGGSFIRVWCS